METAIERSSRKYHENVLEVRPQSLRRVLCSDVGSCVRESHGQSEILEYQEIYFTGGTANKIRASPHVGTTNHGAPAIIFLSTLRRVGRQAC